MFKFIKLDLRLAKTQYNVILIIILFAFFLGIIMEMPTFSIGILFFTTMILSTIPFNIDSNFKSGFYELLPQKTITRIGGRFCYLLINTLISFIFSLLMLSLAKRFGQNISTLHFLIAIAVALIVFWISCIQYVIYYKIETFKNQQLAIWFRLIPIFIIMFGTSFLGDFINENMNLNDLHNKITNNSLLLILFLIAITAIAFFVSIIIATNISENKDI